MNGADQRLRTDALARALFGGLRAALFDLDNTLVETHIDFPEMKRRTLALAAEFGANAEALDRLDILGVVEAAAASIAAVDGSERSLTFHRRALAMLEEIERAQCGAPALLPGAAQALRSMRRSGIAVAVVTRNCRAVALDLIAFAEMSCDLVLSRDDVRRVKPDPDHLLTALRLLSELNAARIDPDAALMVGDNWMDVKAGRAAGMRTIALRRRRPASIFDEVRPDLVLEDMAELNRLWANASVE